MTIGCVSFTMRDKPKSRRLSALLDWARRLAARADGSMTFDAHLARKFLATGELRNLFTEALGWDHHAATLEVRPTTAAGGEWNLRALAQKRGFVAWHCPTPVGKGLPD